MEILSKKGQEVSKGETIAYLDVNHQQDVAKLFADVFEISPEDINIHPDSRLIEVVKLAPIEGFEPSTFGINSPTLHQLSQIGKVAEFHALYDYFH